MENKMQTELKEQEKIWKINKYKPENVLQIMGLKSANWWKSALAFWVVVGNLLFYLFCDCVCVFLKLNRFFFSMLCYCVSYVKITLYFSNITDWRKHEKKYIWQNQTHKNNQ